MGMSRNSKWRRRALAHRLREWKRMPPVGALRDTYGITILRVVRTSGFTYVFTVGAVRATMYQLRDREPCVSCWAPAHLRTGGRRFRGGWFVG